MAIDALLFFGVLYFSTKKKINNGKISHFYLLNNAFRVKRSDVALSIALYLLLDRGFQLFVN